MSALKMGILATPLMLVSLMVMMVYRGLTRLPELVGWLILGVWITATAD